MNRHTKIAILVFPFLMIGGYIASGYYIENEANNNKIYELNTIGSCDVLNEKCVLQADKYKINVFDVAGLTQINSTFPLDKASLFLVDQNNQATHFPMLIGDNRYYWKVKTPLRQKMTSSGRGYKLRLIVDIKGGRYISEFLTKKL